MAPHASSASRRHYLAAWLPLLPTDRLRRSARRADGAGPDESPLVVVAREASALRLVAADAKAQSLGLGPGLTLADARARVPGLAVAEADPRADAALLACLAGWAERYTPLAARDAPDGLVLDIAGCAHLFGGEAAMLDDLVRRLAAMGITAQAAVTSSADAARALARFAPGQVVAPGGEGDAVAPLPVAALGLAPETATTLRRVGLKTIGDLVRRPRATLAARFGGDLVTRLDRALGNAEAPISPERAVPAAIAEERFSEPIAAESDIRATLAALAVTLGECLECRGEGGRRFEAGFFRVDGAVRRIAVETGRPLRDADAVARLFAERLDALADPLDAGFGFDVVRLAAVAAEPLAPAQRRLDGAAGEAEAVAGLVDRLAARFGPERVVRFTPADTHIPERAARTVPALERSRFASNRQTPSLTLPLSGGGRPCGRAWRSLPPERGEMEGGHPSGSGTGTWMAGSSPAPEPPGRPLRLFDPPQPIETLAEIPDGPPLRFRWRRVLHEVARAEGPERIAPEWWRQSDDSLTRDYYRVEDSRGRRFWVYREGLYGRETGHPRWFLRGLFA